MELLWLEVFFRFEGIAWDLKGRADEGSGVERLTLEFPW